MRPIVWGLIVAALGAFFWITFGVVFGIAFMFEEELPPFYSALILITGLAMIFGIPAGIVGEVVRWRRNKRVTKTPSGPAGLKYCTQCGKQVQTGLQYCGYCGTKLQ
jgi:hypothetical protein